MLEPLEQAGLVIVVSAMRLDYWPLVIARHVLQANGTDRLHAVAAGGYVLQSLERNRLHSQVLLGTLQLSHADAHLAHGAAERDVLLKPLWPQEVGSVEGQEQGARGAHSAVYVRLVPQVARQGLKHQLSTSATDHDDLTGRAGEVYARALQHVAGSLYGHLLAGPV